MSSSNKDNILVLSFAAVENPSLFYIQGLAFTPREFDVLSFILSGRTAKRTGSFLNISQKTVERHISSIMSKLGCHSQDKIRDFVEGCDQFFLIKKHYMRLLVESHFKQALRNIAIELQDIEIPVCHLSYDHSKEECTSFVSKLERDFKMAGILCHTKEETITIDKIGSPLPNQIELSWAGKVNLSIFINLESKADNEKNVTTGAYISYNYSYLVIEILKKVLPFKLISKNFKEFQSKYQLYANALQEQTALRTDTNDKSNMGFKKLLFRKNSLFKITCLVIIFLSFDPIIKDENSSNYALSDSKKIEHAWNVPDPTRFFVGRKEFLNKIKQSLTQEKIVIISGLGGIGKTQTALTYANQNRQDYNNKIQFIESQNRDLFENSIINFAVKLQLHNQIEPKMSEKNFRRLKYKKIENMLIDFLKYSDKSLLIFDNLDDIELIKSFLQINQHDILITARKHDWKTYAVLELNVFSEFEAMEYIKDTLLKKYNNLVSESEALSLANELGRLPLAITQAIYTIRNDMNVKEYLLQFKLNREERKKLLTEKALDQDFYKEVVYTTWDINRQKIAKQSRLANDILNTAVYFEADKIPKNFFFNMSQSRNELNNAFRLLIDWCLIRIVDGMEERDSFSINRMFREVVQMKLAESKESNTYLEAAMKVINQHYSYSTFEEKNNKSHLVSHVRAVLDTVNQNNKMDAQLKFNLNYQIGGYLSRIDKFLEAKPYMDMAYVLSKEIILKTSDYRKFLSELGLYSIYSNYNRELYLSLLASEYNKFQNAKEDNLTQDEVAIMFALANLYHAKGEFEKTIAINMRLINSKGFQFMDGGMAIAYASLGSCYSKLKRNYQLSMQYFDQAESIYKDKFNSEHPDMMLFYTVRGEAYFRGHDLSKAEAYFSKTLEYSKTHTQDVYHNNIYLCRSHEGMAKVLLQKNSKDIKILNQALKHINASIEYQTNLNFNRNAKPSEIHPSLQQSLNLKAEVQDLINSLN